MIIFLTVFKKFLIHCSVTVGDDFFRPVELLTFSHFMSARTSGTGLSKTSSYTEALLHFI